MSTIAYSSARPITTSILLVALLGSVANALVALCAISLGVASNSTPFAPIAYITLTVVAAVAGAFGWDLINTKVRHPARVFAWLVPTILLLSLVPDIFIGISGSWPLAIATMTMHLVTIAVAVSIYSWRMPVARK